MHDFVRMCMCVSLCMFLFRFGTQERLFRMEYISNSAFTEGEFSKWKGEVGWAFY